MSFIPSVVRIAEGSGRASRAAAVPGQDEGYGCQSLQATYLVRNPLLCVVATVCLCLWATSVTLAQPIPKMRSSSSQVDPNLTNTKSMTDRLAKRPRWDANEPIELTEPNDLQSEPNETKLKTKLKTPEKESSRIELLISGKGVQETNDVSIELQQFGYSVFKRKVSTFAPILNVPIGPDYIIGPGDSFAVTIWGRTDAHLTLTVDRSGQIILPEVGALKVLGMRFGALESYIHGEMSRKFTDFKVSVAMERLRTIQIFVIGEAATPGTYTVSSLSTVITALYAAGGPTKDGSLRKVRLMRSGGDSNDIDLYNFLTAGDRRTDARLQDGDTILIPLIGPVVAVAGNVKRPAIYEMVRPMSLREVLDLAGGATFAGWLQRIQVERVENHKRRIVADFDLSDKAGQAEQDRVMSMVVQDGDIIKVRSVDDRRENVVELVGHVIRPGKYEWRSGMKLSDILTSYDVLRPQPNLLGGEITRLVPPDLHQMVIPFHLGKLMSGDQSENVELAQYDKIRVFKWDERHVETVRISGMVYDPNEYRLAPSMRVRDLIEQAGGLRKNAYLNKAEVTRTHISQSGMTTEQIDVDLARAVADDPRQNIPLQDYDYLVVRPIPELKFDQTVTIKGEVRFPGTYPITRDETLSSLIERAGGYTSDAYLKGAVFTRESAKEVQRRRLEQMLSEIEESILTSTEQKIGAASDAEMVKGQQAALETKRALVTKLNATEITGRVVVKMAPLEELKGSRSDIKLENEDALTIPRTPGVVHVVGEVFNQTSLLFEEGATVNYYLRKVGGMSKDADTKQVSVIKADGSVISRQQDNVGQAVSWDKQANQWVFGGFMGLPLDPGDTIVVPKKLDKVFWLQTTRDITQIMMQVAVTVGIAFAI
jgi:protein involved in polysaccharide export with SLBB domain